MAYSHDEARNLERYGDQRICLLVLLGISAL